MNDREQRRSYELSILNDVARALEKVTELLG